MGRENPFADYSLLQTSANPFISIPPVANYENDLSHVQRQKRRGPKALSLRESSNGHISNCSLWKGQNEIVGRYSNG